MLNQGIRLSRARARNFSSEGESPVCTPAAARFQGKANPGFRMRNRRCDPALSGTVPLGADPRRRYLRRRMEYARKQWGSSRIQFGELQELDSEQNFDLCYVNGVFHHIAVPERAGAVAWIHAALRTGGRLALFENNPWNPGARMVMKRIPFDRDARMLSVPETTRLVRSNGFTSQVANWSLFYFPRALSFLRWSENALSHLPLGAQYCVYAVK